MGIPIDCRSATVDGFDKVGSYQMSKVVCKICGKKFINQEYLDVHKLEHPEPDAPRLRGWATKYGFADFKEPVTHQEATAAMAAMHELMKQRKKK